MPLTSASSCSLPSPYTSFLLILEIQDTSNYFCFKVLSWLLAKLKKRLHPKVRERTVSTLLLMRSPRLLIIKGREVHFTEDLSRIPASPRTEDFGRWESFVLPTVKRSQSYSPSKRCHGFRTPSAHFTSCSSKTTRSGGHLKWKKDFSPIQSRLGHNLEVT